MDYQCNGFIHDYQPSKIRFGPDCVIQITKDLTEDDLSESLLICGNNIRNNEDTYEPIVDKIADVHMETLIRSESVKHKNDVLKGLEIINSNTIDSIIALGGGSTLDVAGVLAAVASIEEDPDEFLSSESAMDVTDLNFSSPVRPIVAIPTTLTGADITCAASVFNYDTKSGSKENAAEIVVFNTEIMPHTVYYDPAIVASTPDRVLLNSAMNGFDHGIEALYSRNADPITDSTASRGLSILNSSLPNLSQHSKNEHAISDSMIGILLVTYGIVPTPTTSKNSIIHAFGHTLSRRYDISQGHAHGVMAPAVLEHIFKSVSGRREVIAEAFDINVKNKSDDVIANEIIARVREIHQLLGAPTNLRNIGGLQVEDLAGIAEEFSEDFGLQTGPPEYNPSTNDILEILQNAW